MERDELAGVEWVTLCEETWPAGGYLRHMCEHPIGHEGPHSWEHFVLTDVEDHGGI